MDYEVRIQYTGNNGKGVFYIGFNPSFPAMGDLGECHGCGMDSFGSFKSEVRWRVGELRKLGKVNFVFGNNFPSDKRAELEGML